MEEVPAAKMSYKATSHKLLPKTSFENLCVEFIETAIHHLLE